MIEFRELKKYYGSCRAMDIPYIAFPEGSRTAVLGANGSGKSTLLRLLAGELCSFLGDGSHRTGYLPQQFYGFRCSVRKNVELAIWEEEPDTRRKRADTVMEQVGIGHLAQKAGNRLSGGETQRMALARLLAQDNQILLLDEPTSACDIAGSNQIEQVLGVWQGTIIFSTHSPAQAVRLADRAVFLYEGQIAEDGKAEQILFSPETRELRDFLKYWRF